ncbi:hypothetical protein LINPERPRIM_LOCUS11335 [Linum perenne]
MTQRRLLHMEMGSHCQAKLCTIV